LHAVPQIKSIAIATSTALMFTSLRATSLIVSLAVINLFGKDIEITDGLFSKKPNIRLSTYESILQHREILIKKLLSILEIKDIDKNFRGPYHKAIELLGKYRAKEAVSILANIIEYIPEYYESDEWIRSESYYVAACSLTEIGQPSIPAMMSIIRNSTSSKKRDLATWVIVEIEGKEQALNRIEASIIKDDKKQSLIEAKKYIKNYKIEFGNPKFKEIRETLMRQKGILKTKR